ncbi:MAG TPA: hypothetical protein VFJ98_10035 [Mycobacteriales bacterium]|nr:hypothetical protein [Mycobacteriales bacterium]
MRPPRASGGRRGERARGGDRPRGSEEGAAAALTGGGPSQLGIEGSMRARDVSRPRPSDVASAEKLVQVSYRPRSKPHGTPLAAQDDGSGGSSRVSS